ncbi:unnamed protein product [Pseudo-nitzschia multistriata]|uniref:Bacterial bifunctional deaminase-reductase C-terminal domain-containing protein n=1 Tax=Pseudo-nitzschia multistriata TaxID=183589 RepID=A0A448ZGD2_9STRA|nr:unnamed protein product [Pseudo-nitzschia multistriata]
MYLRITLFIICMCRVVDAFTTRSSLCHYAVPSKCSATPKESSSAFPKVRSIPPSSLFLSSENNENALYVPKGITLKIAFDSQGGVADLSSEKSERFTCGESLDMVHRLRRVSDAVLVGRSTVEIDDCTLTVRRVPLLPLDKEPSNGTAPKAKKKQPFRVVLDPNLDLELDQFKIFQDGLETIVIHALSDSDLVDAGSKSTSADEMGNSYFVKSTKKEFPAVTFLGLQPIIDQDKLRLCTRQVRDILAEEFGIHHIMVEGGPNTALQFLRDKTVDRAILVYAPISFKDPLLSNISTSVLEQAGLEPIEGYKLGVDSLKCYSRPELSWPSTPIKSWP